MERKEIDGFPKAMLNGLRDLNHQIFLLDFLILLKLGHGSAEPNTASFNDVRAIRYLMSEAQVLFREQNGHSHILEFFDLLAEFLHDNVRVSA